jgi:nicotinamidase-related amidase
MIRTLGGTRDADGCALLLLDYQDNVLAEIPEPARAGIERNACTAAVAAVEFGIPVLPSTVGVTIGLGGPMIPSLLSALPGAEPIDRSCMNAWDDPAILEAVEEIGVRTWVMAGVVTSVALTYPALCAMADGYDVCFVEDAVADITYPFHQAAVARLVHAGAVPRSTQTLISAWAKARRPLTEIPTGAAASQATRSERRAAQHGRKLTAALG